MEYVTTVSNNNRIIICSTVQKGTEVVVMLLAFEAVILGFYLGNTGSGKRKMDGDGDVMFASWWRRCRTGSGIKLTGWNVEVF